MYISRVLLPLIIHNVALVFGQDDNNKVTEGEFHVISTDFCDEKYDMTMEIHQRKYNRTIEVFDIYLNITRTVDKSLGIRIDVDKCVDGGCKPYQVLTDDDIEHFCNKFAEDNIKELLNYLGLDSFSIPKGQYNVTDYLLDTCDLPQKCVVGSYVARTAIKDGDKEIACFIVIVDFLEVDDSPCGD